jgi:hypothetical protein
VVERCQSLTVASIEDDRMKLFLLQARSRMSWPCPSNSHLGVGQYPIVTPVWGRLKIELMYR